MMHHVLERKTHCLQAETPGSMKTIVVATPAGEDGPVLLAIMAGENLTET